MLDALKTETLDQVRRCTDPDLLDLVYKLLTYEEGNA